MKRTAEGLLLCPYCSEPLTWIPQRWFGRGSFVCDRCGEFPDLAGDAAAAQRAVADAEPDMITIPPRRDERPRVLLVDDAVAHRDLYALMLEPRIAVLTASRGEEALAIAAKEPLDAIVLDVTTPGMNGWTVCERLKTSPLTSDVPVIVLTLDEGAVTVGRAERAGATAILAKPCPVDRLTFAIDLAIRTRGSAASAPAPIVQAPAPMPIITHTRKRRWARKPVKATVPARVDHLPVHLVNVSYGGVCVEIDQPTAELPASFDVMFPASDLLVHADAVWMNRSRDHWVCGAEIPDVTDAWRGLVDRLM